MLKHLIISGAIASASITSLGCSSMGMGGMGGTAGVDGAGGETGIGSEGGRMAGQHLSDSNPWLGGEVGSMLGRNAEKGMKKGSVDDAKR